MRQMLLILCIFALLLGCASVKEPTGKPAAPVASGAAKAAGAEQDNPPKTLALFRAIWAHDVGAIRTQIAEGADPDVPINGYSWKIVEGQKVPMPMLALSLVLSMSDFTTAQKAEIIAIFGKAGADLGIRDDYGDTALHRTLSGGGNLELARALLESGADPNRTSTITLLWNRDGKQTRESYEQAPIFTLLNNKERTVQEKAQFISLLREHKADLNPLDYAGKTPIHTVLSSKGEGREILVRALLEAGADPNAANKDESSVLQSLLGSTDLDCYLDLVRLAMRKGGDPRRLDSYGRTALHHACGLYSYGEEFAKRGIKIGDLIDALLSTGASVDMPDSSGRTALFIAAESRREDAVRHLISRGASPAAKDKQGRTALHELFKAVAPVSPALLEMLTGPGVDLNARDPGGNTALNLAAGRDEYLNVVQHLVEKGADLNIANDNELAPCGTAIQMGAKKNAAFLKSKNGVQYVSIYPAGNEDAASKALLSGDPAAVGAVPLAQLREIKSRTSLGVPATPLHLAVEQGDLRVVEALCRRKVDWNVGDRYGRSPMQLAVLAGRADLVEKLLSAGADPDYADDQGATPFSRAASLRPDIVRLMLARGFTPKDTGPASGAIWTGNLDLVKALYKSTSWNQGALDMCAALGETRIAEYLAPLIPHEKKTPEQVVEEARKNSAVLDEYTAKADAPLEAPKRSGGLAEKRGSFTYIVESWSPWLEMKADKKLKDYPVGVYVPKGCDGSKPYGLLVSMIHAQSANQFPRPEFQKVLDKLNIIWVGFDPYNGIFEAFEDTHECFCLAIVYNMLGYYSIDRSRIYMAGFSWGGRLTGEIVPKQARIFKGGIAIGGCFTTGGRLTPALRYGRERVAMVMDTGDWDYNRRETYNGYSTLTLIGYKNCLFIQEPKKGHAIMSAENFEKALRFLDERGGGR